MDLIKKSKEIRKEIFKMICNSSGGHIAGSFSIVEILVVIYYRILNISPENINSPDRNRLIISKGHCGTALYPILADLGFFEKNELKKYGKKGTILGGHPDRLKIPGVEASTGSLGHGFPFGVGIALGGKLDKMGFNVYTIIGDGEMQEGTIWEASMFAGHNKLDNLVTIIDYNKFQAMDKLENILSLEPLADKWRSFNWEVIEVDGHDINELERVLKLCPFKKNKPSLIIAHTIKGKGISYMENEPIWHYRLPNKDEIEKAIKELNIDKNEMEF